MKALSWPKYLASLGVCGAILLLIILLSPGIGSQSGEVGLATAWKSWLNQDERPEAPLL